VSGRQCRLAALAGDAAAAAAPPAPARAVTIKRLFMQSDDAATAPGERDSMGAGRSGHDEAAAAGALQRAMAERERFLVFALTAADLLLEITPQGRITFAAGAFERRLGRPSSGWLGRPATDLVAPASRPGFARALDLLDARDRLPPTCVRLGNPGGTAMAVAGLRLSGLPGAADRLCLTFSAIPEATAPPPDSLPDRAGLGRAMEAELRDGEGQGQVNLLELTGPDGPLAPRPELAASIAGALAGAVAGGMAGELAAGRYGLLSRSALDVTRIAAEIEALARDAGLEASVAARSLALGTEGLSPMQATRALRYALGAFARGGTRALVAEGFDDGLAGFVARACDRAEALRRVIAERRFRLAFQPIVALADRSVHHFEALLRPLAAAGEAPPGAQEFVTFAETVGLSEDLDWAVVETCAEAARKADGARIACNLSGLSLQAPAFRARLLALLQAEPDLVPRLLIEITETAEIEDEAEAVRTVEALRGLGLPLCIDDFGAGAAALRYLRAFRVDYVKIDGQYVQAALRSEQDRGFVAAMVDLAHNVGAKVVAERIETEAEAAAMQALGVAYGQGWLFGKPGRLPGSL